MRVEYKKPIKRKILDAIEGAKREGREIECIYLDRQEWFEYWTDDPHTRNENSVFVSSMSIGVMHCPNINILLRLEE